MDTKRTYVITGASRGIGKSITELLAADPQNLVLALARDTDRMKQSFSAYPNVLIREVDLSRSDVFEQMTEVTKDLPHIDYLINNAGLLINKPFEELNLADLSRSYQVNVISVMQSVQALLGKMRDTHIVNISSMGGFQGSVKFPGLAAYSTSKAALCSFTELFAEEYKESSIRMNCLCLGAVQTEMLEEAFPGYQASHTADEMASFIIRFTQEAAHFMNGKIIPVSLSTP